MGKSPGMNEGTWVQRGRLLSAQEVRAGSPEEPCELGTGGRVGVGIAERHTPSAEQHSTNKGQHSVLCAGGGEDVAEVIIIMHKTCLDSAF